MKAILNIILISILLTACAQEQVYELGFIGAMTGPVAKYGPYEATAMAVDEINTKGGIKGVKIKLIAEDGKCNSKEAITAAKKLINVDKVKVILGGHCSPESVPIAPIAEQNKVLMLASITTSPHLSDAGDYIFRTSPVNTDQVPLILEVAEKKNYNRIAVLYEQTDYAEPIAAKLKELVPEKVVMYEGYTPNNLVFRTWLTKAKKKNPDAIFLSPQSPDSLFMFVKQMKELGIDIPILGNEILGNKAAFASDTILHEGLIFASPLFEPEAPGTKEFVERYSERYGTDGLPFGFYTAEAYDSVYLIAEAIGEAGYDPDALRDYLYTVKDYQGVSGKIGINEKGDGIREYRLRIVGKNSEIKYYDP